MRSKTIFFLIFFNSLIVTFGNFVFGQFETKQLTSQISTGLLEIDLNNDGKMDLLSVGFDSIVGQPNHLFYYENNSGTFLPPLSVAEMTSFSNDIKLLKADMNNDSFQDILFFDRITGKVDLYINLTNGSLSNPIQVANQFPNMDGIDLGDMDSDGLVDIVVSSLDFNKIVWYKNLGMMGFGASQFIASGNQNDATLRLTILDYNQDGFKDVFYIAQESKQLMLAANLGYGTFDVPSQIDYYSAMSNFNYSPFLNAFDFNQDGTEDLVVNTYASSGDNLVWYEVASGTLSARHELAGFGGISGAYEPFFTFSVDLNLDGFNEIVLVDWDDVFYFPNNNGTLSSTKVTLISNTSSYISDMSVGDFNGDGYPDFVLNFIGSSINYYKNNTTLGFNLVQKLSPEIQQPECPISLDFDTDGLKDLVYFEHNSLKINWLKNRGNGDFDSSQQILDASATPFFFTPVLKKIIAADLDNDGVKDLLALKGTNSSSHLEYFKNQGNLSFGTPVPIWTSANMILSNLVMSDVQTCDLDNDNDLDILFSLYYNGKVGYILNLGSGVFGSEHYIDSTINQPIQIATIDFDNDSDLDILNISTGDQKIRFYENLGNNSFSTPVIISPLSIPSMSKLLVEDIDGDGFQDIILNAKNDSKISWFKNQGGSSFSGQNVITTSMTYPEILLVDYDSDGDQDLIATFSTAPSESMGTYLLENLGNGVFLDEGPKIITIPVGNFIRNDFDLDGDFDFVSTDNRILFTELQLNFKTTVKGKIYFDSNANGLLDSNEVGMNQVQVKTIPTTNYVFSDSEGNYRLNLYDSSNVYSEFTSSFPNWHQTSTPTSYNVSVDSAFTHLDTLNFGFSPTIIQDSIITTLIGGFPRCNDTVNYWINIRNEGTTTPSGLISLKLDSALTYVSANPTPDSIFNGTLYWSFNNLFYFDDTLIDVQVKMPNFLSMGDTLNSNVEAKVLDSVNNVSFNSQDSINQVLICAYDPNEKTSTPEGIGYSGFISSEVKEIEYLIRFQNTGNDTAKVVTLRDQLDQNLDWSSIQPVCGSHDFTASIDPNGLLTFTFNQIDLPDSNVNELASHGFILYTIKVKDNVPAGSVIENHADIYFDYNPAVVTNHKILTLFDCESLFSGAPSADVNYCIGDSVHFGVTVPQTLYYWSSSSPFLENNGQEVNIQIDSSGLYHVAINAKNSFCDIDSIVQFTVPVTPITSIGNTSICQGDSALVFNQYQIVTGLYYDTLQNLQGCDSILVHELNVHEPLIVNFGSVINDTVCISNEPIVFTDSSPLGGNYFGDGVTNNTFNEVIAGIGNHVVYYQYVDSNSCSSSDSVVLTVDECLGMEELTQEVITVYPNPTDGKLHIYFSKPFSGNLTIYDISGKIYFYRPFIESQNIDLSIEGEPGMYFLVTKNEDNMKSIMKLVKE